MSNMIVCPENYADGATLGSNPAMVATLPLSNLQNRDRERMARGAGGESFQEVWGTFAAAVEVDTVILWRHSVVGAADWDLTLYPEASLAGTPVLSATGLAYDAGEFADWDYRWTVYRFPPTTARSFKFTFNLPAVGYFQAGRLFIGRSWSPETNPTIGTKLAWRSNGATERTGGGGMRTRLGGMWREIDFELDWLSAAERAVVQDLALRCGMDREVFISMWPGAGGALERDYAMLGSFLPPDGVVGQGAGWWGNKLLLAES